jgi:hypothetical protein
MSKNSSKAMYLQLMEWLPTLSRPKSRTTSRSATKPGRQSRLNTYKNRGVK